MKRLSLEWVRIEEHATMADGDDNLWMDRREAHGDEDEEKGREFLWKRQEASDLL